MPDQDFKQTQKELQELFKEAHALRDVDLPSALAKLDEACDIIVRVEDRKLRGRHGVELYIQLSRIKQLVEGSDEAAQDQFTSICGRLYTDVLT
jgi:hypothetical protein